jgi:LytS/YehU family sensor histidine kinase
MREKVEAELRFLKVQLNPHFLFNTLNNLYYLTTEKSDKAPAAILQLSEILDYVLNTSKEVVVPFEREWNQAQNYIALELLRYEDRVTVESSILGPFPTCRIAPMTIITLIENAFKHGVMNEASKSWIKITIDNTRPTLQVIVSNSRGSKKYGNGIGLKNLESQLKYLYGENFGIRIAGVENNEFSVNLILPGT